MPVYRFYFLDDADHFIRVVEKNAGDDEEAKTLVRKLAKETPVEVWSGPRKIGRFDEIRKAQRVTPPERQ
jgi:hypothetical protein